MVRLVLVTIAFVGIAVLAGVAYQTKGEKWDILGPAEIENINYNIGMILRQNAAMAQKLKEGGCI